MGNNTEQLERRPTEEALSARDVGEYLHVYVKTPVDMPMHGVGGFLQELSHQIWSIAGARYPLDLRAVYIDSLEVVVSVAALAVSVGQLVVQLRDRFKRDPVAAHYTLNLGYAQHNIRYITFTGGGESVRVGGEEIDAVPKIASIDSSEPDRSLTEDNGATEQYYLGDVFGIGNDLYFLSEVYQKDFVCLIVDEREEKTPQIEAGRYLFFGNISGEWRKYSLHVVNAERRSAPIFTS